MVDDDDPLDAVHAFVEKAYMRLQAGDLLTRCLEMGSQAPIQQMVESLVLAGPQSLSVLREMVLEAGVRKTQLLDDLTQVYSEFENSMKSCGVELAELKTPSAVTQLHSNRLRALLKEQGILDEATQGECVQILRNSRELMASLLQHVSLLDEIESYLHDWLWGLAFQLARQNWANGPASIFSRLYL